MGGGNISGGLSVGYAESGTPGYEYMMEGVARVKDACCWCIRYLQACFAL